MEILPNHIAILVPSVRKAAEYLKQFDFKIEEEEVFEREGTKEVYVEFGRSNSLLLLEAFKPGVYQKAFEKRGPGLHHLAVDTLDLELFLQSIKQSDWTIHPISQETIQHTRTAWLFKRGFPSLIEVQERKTLNKKSLFVSEVSLKIDSTHHQLLKSIGLESIVKSGMNQTFLADSKKIEIKNMWSA